MTLTSARRMRIGPVLVALATLPLGARTAAADPTWNYGIGVESVNNYGGVGDLTNPIANGDGFINKMTTTPGTPWTWMFRFTDGTVWDSDFVDPDAGFPAGQDTWNFDQSGTAIAYFTGHGTCSGCWDFWAGDPAAQCQHTWQCTNPNVAHGEMLPGTCRAAPGLAGACCYMSHRQLLTHGATVHFWNAVTYSANMMKLGESNFSGAWAGAGTNGGVNMAVLDLSCGVLTPYWVQQLGPVFAGVHYVATIMPVNGDTAMVADRGAAFANRWAANSYEPMANA